MSISLSLSLHLALYLYLCLSLSMSPLEIVRAFTFVVNQGLALYWGTSRWSNMEIMVRRDQRILLIRAYFKESVQLQRTEKFQTSKHLKISCQKKFHFPKFPTTFFSHFLYFLCFSPSKRCKYNCTNQLFASFIPKISRFS